MAIADRYEGKCAGKCGCGVELIWTRTATDQWVTTHIDDERNLYCSNASLDSTPVVS